MKQILSRGRRLELHGYAGRWKMGWLEDLSNIEELPLILIVLTSCAQLVIEISLASAVFFWRDVAQGHFASS